MTPEFLQPRLLLLVSVSLHLPSLFARLILSLLSGSSNTPPPPPHLSVTFGGTSRNEGLRFDPRSCDRSMLSGQLSAAEGLIPPGDLDDPIGYERQDQIS